MNKDLDEFKKFPTMENFKKAVEGLAPGRIAAKTRFYRSISSRPLRNWERAWVDYSSEVPQPVHVPSATKVMRAKADGITWC